MAPGDAIIQMDETENGGESSDSDGDGGEVRYILIHDHNQSISNF